MENKSLRRRHLDAGKDRERTLVADEPACVDERMLFLFDELEGLAGTYYEVMLAAAVAKKDRERTLVADEPACVELR